MSFGPVFDAHVGSDPTIARWVVGAFSIVMFWLILQDRRRVKALRAGVIERRWQWIGEALPHYFPERGLLKDSRKLRVSNAFSGSVRGIEFICCDCTLGEGKHRTRLTLISARSANDPFSFQRFDPSFTLTHSESWFGIKLSGKNWPLGDRLIPAERVFAIVESIA